MPNQQVKDKGNAKTFGVSLVIGYITNDGDSVSVLGGSCVGVTPAGTIR